MEKKDPDNTCPRCQGKLRKSFASVSGNAKYVNVVCTECGFKETKCLGVLG